jgi:hypothetical protein
MVKDQVYCGDIESETSAHSGMSYWVFTNSYVYEYYKKKCYRRTLPYSENILT